MSSLVSATPRRGAILVVEDREDVRSGLAQLLEFHGFLVAEAPDGQAALAHLQRGDDAIALILLDLMLPGNLSGRDIRGQWESWPDGTHWDLDLETFYIDQRSRVGF